MTVQKYFAKGKSNPYKKKTLVLNVKFKVCPHQKTPQFFTRDNKQCLSFNTEINKTTLILIYSCVD